MIIPEDHNLPLKEDDISGFVAQVLISRILEEENVQDPLVYTEGIRQECSSMKY